MGISHIHHLEISACDNLVSCTGLTNIIGSVTLDYCESLCFLDGLRGIPEVVLEGCESLTKFEGLGNHESLHIFRTPAFFSFLDEFQKKNLHHDIFRYCETFICGLLLVQTRERNLKYGKGILSFFVSFFSTRFCSFQKISSSKSFYFIFVHKNKLKYISKFNIATD
jgi:hypothetical protein